MSQQLDAAAIEQQESPATELIDRIEKQMQSIDEDASASSSISLAICPQRIAQLLTAIIIALSVTGTIVDYVIYQVLPGPEHRLSRLLNRLDLGHEPSVPAFYSSFALLAAAALLAVIAWGAHQRGNFDARYWAVLALLFVGLSLDEMVMLHEMVSNVLEDAFAPSGALYFPWVIPALLSVAVVGGCYLRFLFRLDRATRRRFTLAACLFVGGAAGMEMVAGIVVERHGVASVGHTVVQTVEETCEMAGVAVFIYALLLYIQQQWGRVEITLRNRRPHLNERTS